MPRADSQLEKSVYATLIIDCLFAGLPGDDLRTHNPCMGGDKKEDAHTFCCHLTPVLKVCISCGCIFCFP